MDEKTFNSLIKKIDLRLSGVEKLSSDNISPIPPLEASASEGIIITEGMDIEHMSMQNVLFTHTLLHFLYSKGGSSSLNKVSIEKLHAVVKKKLPSHEYFDRLDEDKNEFN